MGIRTERVAKLLQREIADLLQTDFSEEVPAMVTVTGVRVTKDLSIAYVDVSVFGQDLTQRQAAFRHLEELTPRVRSALAQRIRHQVRVIPDVRFFLDESLQRVKRMDDLFERIRAERERREGPAPTEGTPDGPGGEGPEAAPGSGDIAALGTTRTGSSGNTGGTGGDDDGYGDPDSNG